MKKGLWSPDEDERLILSIKRHPNCTWSAIARKAGLQRCGKSCRRRWMNHLRPDLKRGKFRTEETQLIIDLREVLGNRWSEIASRLPGRTDNDVKNLWYALQKKKRSESRKQPQRNDQEMPWGSPSGSSAADGSNVKLEIDIEEDSSSRRDVFSANSSNATAEFAFTAKSAAMEMQHRLRSNGYKLVDQPDLKGQAFSTHGETNFHLNYETARDFRHHQITSYPIEMKKMSDSTKCSTIGGSSLGKLAEELGLQISEDDEVFMREQQNVHSLEWQHCHDGTKMLETYSPSTCKEQSRCEESSQDTFWQDVLCSISNWSAPDLIKQFDYLT